MRDIGLEIRSGVLQTSLYIESLISLLLSKLLGIQNPKTSRSFGNTSYSLSFSAKVNLLIDIGALENADRDMFQTFMEVRNQLMHNLEAESFESCFKIIGNNQGEKIIRKYKIDATYPKELQLRGAMIALEDHLVTLTKKVIDLIDRREEEDTQHVVNEISTKSLNATLNRFSIVVKQIFGDIGFVDESDPSPPLKLGDVIMNLFDDLLKKEIEQQLKSKYPDHYTDIESSTL